MFLSTIFVPKREFIVSPKEILDFRKDSICSSKGNHSFQRTDFVSKDNICFQKGIQSFPK